MKVVKSASQYTETAVDEIKLLKKVSLPTKMFPRMVACLVPLNFWQSPNISHEFPSSCLSFLSPSSVTNRIGVNLSRFANCKRDSSELFLDGDSEL